jgi:hypothetical protein
MPADLIAPPQQARLADALFASSRHWRASLHFNKGLAGAPRRRLRKPKGCRRIRGTNAFALAIIASAGPPAYAGVPGAGPDVAVARKNGASVIAAMGELRKVAPDGGAYVPKQISSTSNAVRILGTELSAACHCQEKNTTRRASSSCTRRGQRRMERGRLHPHRLTLQR